MMVVLSSREPSLKELCHGISPSGSKNRSRTYRRGLGHELIISE